MRIQKVGYLDNGNFGIAIARQTAHWRFQVAARPGNELHHFSIARRIALRAGIVFANSCPLRREGEPGPETRTPAMHSILVHAGVNKLNFSSNLQVF